MMNRRRRYDEKKDNRFGGSKSPKSPVSVGEEYIVSIEQIGRDTGGLVI